MAVLLELYPAPVAVTQAVAVPATAERLTAVNTYVIEVILWAGRDGGANAGNVFIGSATVDSVTPRQIELAPGETMTISARAGMMFDLYDLWVDAAVATDGVRGFYYPRPV